EGKVKAVIQRKSQPMEPLPPSAPQPTKDTLFANPQPEPESESESESDQEEAAGDNEKGKQKATD
ncbi:MAG: hypothetical protein KAY24_01635, partial [Candidatus Eisenbacteria sp.]|nr:hypothetical protein [Candidatus Eisenbacteria bacterium]